MARYGKKRGFKRRRGLRFPRVKKVIVVQRRGGSHL